MVSAIGSSVADQAEKPIRTWLFLDPNEVKKNLILIEDAYGMCANCKKLGLNFVNDQSCPECGAQFKYAASKLKKPGEIAKILRRIRKEGLSIKLIERDDYERGSAKDALGDLFK